MSADILEHKNLFQTVRQLPFKIRFSLLEMLMKSIREDLNFQSTQDDHVEVDSNLMDIQQYNIQTEPVIRGEDVRGIVQPKTPILTKTDYRDAYTDYLVEKYS